MWPSRALWDTLLYPNQPPAAGLAEHGSLIDLVPHQRTPHICPGYSSTPQMSLKCRLSLGNWIQNTGDLISVINRSWTAMFHILKQRHKKKVNRPSRTRETFKTVQDIYMGTADTAYSTGYDVSSQITTVLSRYSKYLLQEIWIAPAASPTVLTCPARLWPVAKLVYNHFRCSLSCLICPFTDDDGSPIKPVSCFSHMGGYLQHHRCLCSVKWSEPLAAGWLTHSLGCTSCVD